MSKAPEVRKLGEESFKKNSVECIPLEENGLSKAT